MNKFGKKHPFRYATIRLGRDRAMSAGDFKRRPDRGGSTDQNKVKLALAVPREVVRVTIAGMQLCCTIRQAPSNPRQAGRDERPRDLPARPSTLLGMLARGWAVYKHHGAEPTLSALLYKPSRRIERSATSALAMVDGCDDPHARGLLPARSTRKLDGFARMRSVASLGGRSWRRAL